MTNSLDKQNCPLNGAVLKRHWYYHKARIAELEAAHASQQAKIDALENKLAEVSKDFIQAITDEENQPSQYGTVPLQWYENLENKIDRITFNVGVVIDSLEGSYENHAIRKKLQAAIDDQAIKKDKQ